MILPLKLLLSKIQFLHRKEMYKRVVIFAALFPSQKSIFIFFLHHIEQLHHSQLKLSFYCVKQNLETLKVDFAWHSPLVFDLFESLESWLSSEAHLDLFVNTWTHFIVLKQIKFWWISSSSSPVTSSSLCWVSGVAGAAPDPDDEDPEDDGDDRSDGEEDDISLCHEPELLMWTL